MKEGQQIRSALVSDGAVAGVVGTRVHPAGEAPQNSPKPYITYQRVIGLQQMTLADTGLERENVSVQIDLYGDNVAALDDLAEKVVLAIKAALRVGAVDTGPQLYEPEPDLHRVSLDFSLWL